MENLIALLNYFLAIGGLILCGAACIFFFDIYSKNMTLGKLVKAYGLIGALGITVASTAMTLVYSEIFGFVPCGLCWLQRIFLYPQVALLCVAIFYKDKFVARYGIALSLCGILVSLYQHYLQMGGKEIVTCPIVQAGADCAERILFEFGFVTFPLISAFLFIFLTALYVYILKTR